MGKKCIPGLFCIDNMTLFLGFILFIFIIYFSYRLSALANKSQGNCTSSVVPANALANASANAPSVVVYNNSASGGNSRYEDPLSNPYVPPEQIIYPVLRPVATQPYSANYTQIGILTRKNTSSSTSSSDILPLMGRRQRNSRDKWQYYTMSGGGNGNIQTKLPIRVNGKSGSGEYGCDEIYSNDTVFVEGYKDLFVATVYENNMFSYVF
jgi:hypothetical protein